MVQTPGPGFTLGKQKRQVALEGAGETRWFTEVSVTRYSTIFLVGDPFLVVGFAGLKRPKRE
jgi:hypothetical protein